jgi:hypothetical protein
MFTCWRHGLLSVHPERPQIENIGFGEDATHTPLFDKANPLVAQVASPLTYPLRHNFDIEADVAVERQLARIRYQIDWLAEGAAIAERVGPLGLLIVKIAKALRVRAFGRTA